MRNKRRKALTSAKAARRGVAGAREEAIAASRHAGNEGRVIVKRALRRDDDEEFWSEWA